MTLVIDTGVAEFTPDPLYGIPDWFRDIYPEDTAPAKLVHDYAYNLIGKISEYRSMKYARNHLIGHWGFLRGLAETHPEIFDEVLSVYAETWASSK